MSQKGYRAPSDIRKGLAAPGARNRRFKQHADSGSLPSEKARVSCLNELSMIDREPSQVHGLRAHHVDSLRSLATSRAAPRRGCRVLTCDEMAVPNDVGLRVRSLGIHTPVASEHIFRRERAAPS